MAGEADLTLKLTKPSDFKTLWDKWVADLTKDNKLKAELTDKKTFTIALETSDLKLVAGEGESITLDAALAGKTVNVNFLNAFAEVKNPLKMDASAISEKNVTISLPETDAAFDLQLTSAKAFVTLASAGETTLNHLTLTNNGAGYATIISSGVNIKAYIPNGYAVLADGASIEAVAPAANATAECKKANSGIEVENVTKGGKKVYVTNVVAMNDITVKTTPYNNQYTAITKITFEEGKKVTIEGSAHIDEIVGAKNATLSIGEDGLKNVAKVSNVTVENTTINVYGTTFASTTLKGTVKPVDIESLSGVTIAEGKSVVVDITAGEFTFTFDGVEFAKDATVEIGETSFLKPIMGADGKQAVRENYWFAIDLTQPADPSTNVNVKIVHKKSDIPAENLEGNTAERPLWGQLTSTPLFETLDGEEANVVLAFNGGKYKGNTLTAVDVQEIASKTSKNKDDEGNALIQPEIEVNGQLYKWYNAHGEEESAEDAEWILVTIAK